ncbi:MAG: hypothetical protein DMG90_18230 [Acidobacteria bacterium]|jgi:LssY C-terminus|nr:MAG: hypothetical protein DMG90_18230 [Acidobacteriota bacterium]
MAGALKWLWVLMCGASLCAIPLMADKPGAKPSDQPQADTATSSTATLDGQPAEEDEPSEELAPAAVQMDVSKVPQLIQALYQATRETKENQILDRLATAKSLIATADLKATDDQGRTALHWAVFGSSYNIKPRVLVAYADIANDLIQRGIEINKEDVYQDTALDYLLYSPTFEMQTLLIEHGATSGFLAASYQYFKQMLQCSGDKDLSKIPVSSNADLKPGLTLSLRLDTPVYSDRSRTGDPITATVSYPLCKSGENISCEQGELLIPPGTKVNGTVLFAQKAPNKYTRPRLVLDFSNVVHREDLYSPLYAHVLAVDNARETVQNNEILGIVQPHASKKFSIAFMALGAANPLAGYAVRGVQTVYGLSLRREIVYPPGTDVQAQIVRYSILKQKEAWPGWQELKVNSQLEHLVRSAPMRTTATNQVPSDPTNLMFIGSEKEVVSAFSEAGWIPASDLNVKSALKTATATLRQTGYSEGPMSTLLLHGKPPDLVFQKSLNTFAKRHHLRIWQIKPTYEGRAVWVAAATHDIATSNERGGTKWSHRIDPHIDRERDWVVSDLLFIGSAASYADVSRPNAPTKLGNATGDNILTDGKMSVVELTQGRVPTENEPAPTLSTRPTK